MIKFIIDSTIIECPICYETKKKIFTGRCNHSWCLDCHNKMIKYHTCPLCRTPFRHPTEYLRTPPISPISMEAMRRSVNRNIQLERRNRFSRANRRNRQQVIDTFHQIVNERINRNNDRNNRNNQNNNRTLCSCIIS
jgi:hypothetical protein